MNLTLILTYQLLPCLVIAISDLLYKYICLIVLIIHIQTCSSHIYEWDTRCCRVEVLFSILQETGDLFQQVDFCCLTAPDAIRREKIAGSQFLLEELSAMYFIRNKR